MTRHCLFNRNIVPQKEASIALTDLALLRGYGIFDFFRCIGTSPLFFDDYLDRFFNSAAEMRLEIPVSKSYLKKLVLELIQANGISDSGIRLVLTGGESHNGYTPGVPTLFALNETINFPDKSIYENGVKLRTIDYERPLPKIKTLNYMLGINMLETLNEQNAFDVLYCRNDMISELTRSNFFIVDEFGKLVTASQSVLMGITRKYTLELAQNIVPVDFRYPVYEELESVQEAFLTGTTKRILPITTIDDITIGTGTPGPVTRQLMASFRELESNQIILNS